MQTRLLEELGRKVYRPFAARLNGRARSHAVPIHLINEADLTSVKGVRTFSNRPNRRFQADIVQSVRQERQDELPQRPDGSVEYSILALSGGGSRGAFGAGFIYGWSQSGKKPSFKIVTGVSSGALVAPFAFIGPEYNEELKEIFTSTTARDVFRVRNVVSWLWHDSFAKTKPLAKLVARHTTRRSLEAIAEAHAQGRRLYVGTTNLDAQCMVVWNMGAIAASPHPDAALIFQKVLLASASIPSMFPPVYFDVEARGRQYTEMHVDGEVIAGVFFSDFMLNLPDARHQVVGPDAPTSVSAYVICNGKLSPNPDRVRRNLPTITRRALTTLNKAHTRDHIRHIANVLTQKEIDLNFAAIPDTYLLPDNKPAFNRREMTSLFDLGAQIAGSGYPWRKFPQGAVI